MRLVKCQVTCRICGNTLDTITLNADAENMHAQSIAMLMPEAIDEHRMLTGCPANNGWDVGEKVPV